MRVGIFEWLLLILVIFNHSNISWIEDAGVIQKVNKVIIWCDSNPS